MILCCVFYLAWWVIAFKPVGAVKGMKSGWLLILAFISGLCSVILISSGVSRTDDASLLIPVRWTILSAIVLYIALLAGTGAVMKRPVTTELLLIIGWCALTVAEVSALYGRGAYSKATAVALIIAVVIVSIISLVCYLVYYNLDSVKGYYDGMVPLVAAAVMMAVISFTAS